MKYSFLTRSRIILFCVVLFAGILLAKLFFVQVVQGKTYSEAADRQYATASSDIFERGNIYFERKDGQLVSAATQVSGFKMAINTAKIIDPEDTYEKLSKVTEIAHGDFIA